MLLEKEEIKERATTTINYLNEYSLFKPSDNERRIDPLLDYWINHFIYTFPRFRDTLVVPASTAPVEHIIYYFQLVGNPQVEKETS